MTITEPPAPSPRRPHGRRPLLGLLGLVFAVIVIWFGAFEWLERGWIAPHHPSWIRALYIVRGVGSTLMVAALMAWSFLRRHGLSAAGPGPSTGPLSAMLFPELDPEAEESVRLREHARWMIRLRWSVILAATALVLLSCEVFRLLPPGTTWPLLATILVLALTNLAYAGLWRRAAHAAVMLRIQIYADLILLTLLVHFSGGLENPLFLLYIFHVLLAGMMLTRMDGLLAAAASLLLCSLLGVGELSEVVGHVTNRIFHHGGGGHAAHDPLFVIGRLSALGLLLLGTAHFTTWLREQLRRNHERLRLAAAEAILERRRLEGVMDATDAGLLLLDRGGQVAWANRPLRGAPGHEAVSAGLRFAPDTCGRLLGCGRCAARVVFETGTGLREERQWFDGEGKARTELVALAPIKDDRGQVVQVIELIHDITERKAAELEMVRAAKLTALGRLSAGMAHEIGNPLSSMMTRVRRLQEDVADPSQRALLEPLEEQLERVHRLVRGISSFSRAGPAERRAYRIAEVLQSTLSVLKFDRQARLMDIQLEIAPALPEAMGDPDQLQQVFLNLGMNAAEAMKAGGRLCYRAALKGRELLVEVSDTGAGVDPAVRSHIFEPFITTKADGSGLGLAITQQIVRSHGGRIAFRSTPGKGSTFTVSLPLAGGPA